jgi:hypothetical protein
MIIKSRIYFLIQLNLILPATRLIAYCVAVYPTVFVSQCDVEYISVKTNANIGFIYKYMDEDR